jgi:hypothetical protein
MFWLNGRVYNRPSPLLTQEETFGDDIAHQEEAKEEVRHRKASVWVETYSARKSNAMMVFFSEHLPATVEFLTHLPPAQSWLAKMNEVSHK